MTSLCSSLQPKSGFEFEPQSTEARGLAWYARDAQGLAFARANAEVQGSALAATRPFTKSSCSRFTRTPGCLNPPELPASSGGGGGGVELAWFAEHAGSAIQAQKS